MQLPTSAVLFFALLGSVASALPQPQDASGDGNSANPASPPTTTAPVDNPFTIYTSMTNSLGVITGMPDIPALPSLPDAVTDIPALPTLITTQPILASIPAGLTSGLNTVTLANTTAIVSVGESVTSVVEPSTTSAPSRSESTRPSGSGSGFDSGSGEDSPDTASSTGLAAMPTAVVGYAAAGLGLVAVLI